MPETSKGAIALEFAGFWRRFGAWIIDFIVLGAIFSVLEPLLWPDFGKIVSFTTNFDSNYWVGQFRALSNIVSILVSGIYFVGFWVWRGQSLGMMVAGIKVIQTDGSQVDIGRAVIRYLGYLISFIPLFLGFIWIALDSHKQGWHDKLAETYVVKIPAVPEAHAATPPTAAA
ncbi:putative membrane protein YckC, RDD family [Dehalogenimonas formicexedens]|uniref:Putative membrane protein YckC, RDD family n=1 Tax=Dehalogenimonas formicexedens TaxID=1839801 RepID=A0A1P8F511_9CHLR|nr:RDD family protein [Dehalogenimonas formicexedens]APV43518.1 putative membrane protein YckC, RDD family [Dehalogenimonas formicexedens]